VYFGAHYTFFNKTFITFIYIYIKDSTETSLTKVCI